MESEYPQGDRAMSFEFTPGKLLLCTVAANQAEQLVAASKNGGARGGSIAFGRGLGGSLPDQPFLLADKEVDIVFILMGSETPDVVEAVTATAALYPEELRGTAMLLDVSDMLTRDMPSTLLPSETRSMQSGYSLITLIVNDGVADDVMAAARAAGATGGTVMSARGTGTEEDVKYFGISLIPEKEILMIAAPEASVAPILAAIREVSDLSEPGSGIVYTMNIEQFIILGK